MDRRVLKMYPVGYSEFGYNDPVSAALVVSAVAGAAGTVQSIRSAKDQKKAMADAEAKAAKEAEKQRLEADKLRQSEAQKMQEQTKRLLTGQRGGGLLFGTEAGTQGTSNTLGG